jgi:hypothetical protein
MQLNPIYKLGDIVYLKTDKEQLERMVTGYNVRNTNIAYYLSAGITETMHYSFEISKDKDIVKSL